MRKIIKGQDELNNWLKPKLNNNIKKRIKVLFETQKNYKLIFEKIEYKNNIEIFLQIAVTVIEKLQSYIETEKFAILFNSTLTKLFEDYVETVKKAITINENLTIELMEIYHNKMGNLRQIIIPSSTLFKVFSEGLLDMKLNTKNNDERSSQESFFSDLMKTFNKKYYDNVYNYVENHPATKDIDFNYLLSQNLNYYEVSRYPCSLLKHLFEIIDSHEINPNNAFSEKGFTSKEIEEFKKKYSDQIPNSFEAFFDFLNSLNINIRRFAAHRVFDPSCEQFEEIDERILDKERMFSSNELLLIGSILSTILNLFNCWSLLFIINYKYHNQEDFLSESNSLKVILYKSYSLYRGSPINDYKYLIRKVKRTRKLKRINDPHILTSADIEFYIFRKFLNSHLDYA